MAAFDTPPFETPTQRPELLPSENATVEVMVSGTFDKVVASIHAKANISHIIRSILLRLIMDM